MTRSLTFNSILGKKLYNTFKSSSHGLKRAKEFVVNQLIDEIFKTDLFESRDELNFLLHIEHDPTTDTTASKGYPIKRYEREIMKDSKDREKTETKIVRITTPDVPVANQTYETLKATTKFKLASAIKELMDQTRHKQVSWQTLDELLEQTEALLYNNLAEHANEFQASLHKKIDEYKEKGPGEESEYTHEMTPIILPERPLHERRTHIN